MDVGIINFAIQMNQPVPELSHLPEFDTLFRVQQIIFLEHFK